MTTLKPKAAELTLPFLSEQPSEPFRLYPKDSCSLPTTPAFTNELRTIGGFENHKFLLIFEIPSSAFHDLSQGPPNFDEDDEDTVFVYDFGSQTNVHYGLPMKFALYRHKYSSVLHFRSILSCESGVQKVLPIIRDLKNSTLSLSLLKENGDILQPEKLAFCQRGAKGGLCFRIRDFITFEVLNFLIGQTKSVILRIQFIGTSLTIQSTQDKNSNESYDPKTPEDEPSENYRNTLYQLVRDDEFNSFLRSWASSTKFANVRIRIQDNDKAVSIVPAHRVLLAAHSQALGGLLRPQDDVVVLEGIDQFSLLVLLDYIYSGEIHCNDLRTLVVLAKFGDKLKVFGLKDKCIRDIVLMFSNCVTNVKHIAACFKLGEMLSASALTDKAVECFRVMKLCQQCIDFSYANVLMDITRNTENEFNEILAKLHERSSPISENIWTLGQSMTDVKLLGTASDCWHGHIYVIPPELCQSIANACIDEDVITEQFSVVQHFEAEEGFYEFAGNESNGINLRVTSMPNSLDSAKLDADDDHLNESIANLGISKPDYLSIVAESMGVVLKASIFDSLGRILNSRNCRGVLIGGNYEFWEIVNFITSDVMAKWDRTNELLFRLSFGVSQSYPTVRAMSQTDKNYRHFKKFDAGFLEKVNMDPYKRRLIKQLGCDMYSDATMTMVNKSRNLILRIPVHAIVLSAMSPHFEKCFEISADLRLVEGPYSKETIQTLLDFIYGEDISISHVGLAIELISAGDEFQISGLQDKCVSTLCSCQLDLQTCIHLYEVGIGVQSISLQDIAIKFFRRNKYEAAKFPEFQALLDRHPEFLKLIELA